MKRPISVILLLLLILAVIVWWRFPLVSGKWNKQTLYVALIDTWHSTTTDGRAYALWIDDDGAEGVFRAMHIAEQAGIIPCFAISPETMTPQVTDSLATWQRRGLAGIALHGLRHESWKDWSEQQVSNDIRTSLKRLHEQGFDTAKILRIVVPPHGCNTRAIRKAIRKLGCQMVTGASIVNPSRQVFQWGRISITPQTDTAAMRKLLQKAYERRAFVVFGTHSSMPSQFSEKKTREVLRMAKESGFDFIP